jgi:hypothetical protein
MRALPLSAILLLLSTLTASAFDKKNLEEAIEMAVLSKNMNGDGSSQMGTPDKVSGFGRWELKWEGKEENSPPGKFGGFRKFCNRWAVFESTTDEKTYAIVLRGTIDDPLSIIQNALATTTKAGAVWFKDNHTAHQNRAHVLQLSNDDQAEVHLGFAGGIVDILFHRGGDDDHPKGLIKVLKDKIEPDSKVFITGHSQGAALATLLHSFLMNRAQPNNAAYGLSGKGFKIQSYVFAQPKPGNWDFAMDFSRALFESGGSAYVINNSWDWVPQAPLSVQWPSEFTARVLQSYSGASSPVVNSVVELAGSYAMIEGSLRTGLAGAVRGLESNINGFDVIKEKALRELPLYIGKVAAFRSCRRFPMSLLPCDEPPSLPNVLDIIFKDRTQGLSSNLGSFDNDLDIRYLDFDQGAPTPADGKSINYTPAGTLVALPISAQAKAAKDDLTLQHHMRLYIEGLCQMRGGADCPEAWLSSGLASGTAH